MGEKNLNLRFWPGVTCDVLFTRPTFKLLIYNHCRSNGFAERHVYNWPELGVTYQSCANHSVYCLFSSISTESFHFRDQKIRRDQIVPSLASDITKRTPRVCSGVNRSRNMATEAMYKSCTPTGTSFCCLAKCILTDRKQSAVTSRIT